MSSESSHCHRMTTHSKIERSQRKGDGRMLESYGEPNASKLEPKRYLLFTWIRKALNEKRYTKRTIIKNFGRAKEDTDFCTLPYSPLPPCNNPRWSPPIERVRNICLLSKARNTWSKSSSGDHVPWIHPISLQSYQMSCTKSPIIRILDAAL